MPLEVPRSASMAFMGVLLEKYPDLFTWYSLRSPAPGTVNPFNIPYATGRSFQRFTRFPRLKQFIQYFPWAWDSGRKAAAFGRAQKVQAVLADLAFEAVVAGRVAARHLGVPLLVMVHDDPVSRLRVKDTPGWFLELYEREFARTLRASRRCAVICDYMGETYQKRYGVETITLFPGVEAEKCLPPRVFDPGRKSIVIGSVGSATSVANWDTLLEAVRLLNQRHGAGKFRILHLGAYPKDLPLSPDVETTGWLPESDFVHQLRRMDLGFLNWGFAPELEETRSTSFPLKISSYIQAQVPMLALGPGDSTVVRFVQDYHCGLACIKPEVDTLAAQVEALAFNEKIYSVAMEGVVTLKNVFSRPIFFERFEQFVRSAA